MMRLFFAAVIALLLSVGNTFAGDAVVVSYEKDKLVVTIDGKERTIKFVEGEPHVHGTDGKILKGKALADAPKKGVKLEIEEKDGKIEEIMIKK